MFGVSSVNDQIHVESVMALRAGHSPGTTSPPWMLGIGALELDQYLGIVNHQQRGLHDEVSVLLLVQDKRIEAYIRGYFDVVTQTWQWAMYPKNFQRYSFMHLSECHCESPEW